MTWIFESLYALELKHLDEVWEICQWRRGELAQAYFGSLPPLRVDAVYLADLHFRGITVSELPLSPRLAAFVSSVRHLGVWREGIMLACLLECSACTFDPKLVIPDVEKAGLCPLIALVHVVEDVERFLRRAQEIATKQLVTLAKLKVVPRKLRKARDLWWKVDPKGEALPSRLAPGNRSSVLASYLAETFPEQVAHFVDADWYAAGHRVRGLGYERDCLSKRQFLFNPHEENYTKDGRDQGQHPLKSLFGVPLSPREMVTMVVVSDSSIDAAGFRYGLTCVLRDAGIFVAWIVLKPGARAKDLVTAWQNAPLVHVGLTLYNLNDVITAKYRLEEELSGDLMELVAEAEKKSQWSSFIFVNEGALYPDLRCDRYPVLVERVRQIIRNAGGVVLEGKEYVGRIALRDSMHFAVESTEAVVQMYSEDVIDYVRKRTAGEKHVQAPRASISRQSAAEKAGITQLAMAATERVRKEEAFCEEQASITQPAKETAEIVWEDVARRIAELPASLDPDVIDEVPHALKRPCALPEGDDRSGKWKTSRYLHPAVRSDQDNVEPDPASASSAGRDLGPFDQERFRLWMEASSVERAHGCLGHDLVEELVRVQAVCLEAIPVDAEAALENMQDRLAPWAPLVGDLRAVELRVLQIQGVKTSTERTRIVRARYLNRCGAQKKNASSARRILQAEYDFALWILGSGRYTTGIVGASVVRILLELREPAHDSQRAAEHTSLPACTARPARKVRRQVDTRVVYRAPDGSEECPGGVRMDQGTAWDRFFAPLVTEDVDAGALERMQNAFRLWWSYCPQSHRKYDHASCRLLSFEEVVDLYNSTGSDVRDFSYYYSSEMTALVDLPASVLEQVADTEGLKVYHANPNLLPREVRSYYEKRHSLPYIMAVVAGEDATPRTPSEE